jgi:hypothetical protein
MIWVITSPKRIHEEERIIADLLAAGVPPYTTQEARMDC